MKKFFVFMIMVGIGFSSFAATDNPRITNAIKDAAGKLPIVAAYLESQYDELGRKKAEVQTRYDKCTSRKFPPESVQAENVIKRLSGFDTLDDFYYAYVNNEKSLQGITAQDGIIETYAFVLRVQKSLNEPYEKSINDTLKDEAERYNAILPKHKDEFETMMYHMMSYGYYMEHLARLFNIIDAKRKEGTAAELKAADLTYEEGAEFLMNVPYTAKMLRKHIIDNLTDEDKAALYHSCPDLFPQFEEYKR